MTPPRCRWFRFSLRTLFVVVTLFACWLGYQLHWIRERRRVLARHDATGLNATWTLPDGSIDGDRPPWPLEWFGQIGYQQVDLVFESPDDVEIQRIRRLYPEARVVVELPAGVKKFPPLSP